MAKTITFIADMVLPSEAICNLEHEQKVLNEAVQRGQHVVIFGRRNTGKTSLVKSVAIPAFRRRNARGLAVFVDFLGVRDMEDLEARIRVALQHALAKVFPTQELFRTAAELLKGIRPNMTMDSVTGEVSFTVSVATSSGKLSLERLFESIGEYHAKHCVLLAMDEFQDISFVPAAQAKLRTAMQNLPTDLPVIVLGSKRHLLSKIFAAPKAPFANWGRDIEMPAISDFAYHEYIQQRLKCRGLSMALEAVTYLQEQMSHIPEAINLVCLEIMNDPAELIDEIGIRQIAQAINQLLENRKGRFEEYLTNFTANEIRVLRVISANAPVPAPSAKKFLASAAVSSAGVLKIFKGFEDDAVIYRMPNGYILADPLLAKFLLRYREG